MVGEESEEVFRDSGLGEEEVIRGMKWNEESWRATEEIEIERSVRVRVGETE